jgi:hypothetical protein
LKPAAAIATRQFQRLYAQLGVFTIIHRAPLPLDALGSGGHIGRFIVQAGTKAEIRKQLSTLRINKSIASHPAKSCWHQPSLETLARQSDWAERTFEEIQRCYRGGQQWLM